MPITDTTSPTSYAAARKEVHWAFRPAMVHFTPFLEEVSLMRPMIDEALARVAERQEAERQAAAAAKKPKGGRPGSAGKKPKGGKPNR